MGICGGSGSGKSTLADRIVHHLQAERGADAACVLSFDAYYHDLPHLPFEERATVNYDHPDSLDHRLLVYHLQALRSGQEVAVPVYDFTAHRRSADLHIVDPCEVVVVEGILLFAFAPVRDELDLRVFRRCPEPVRFSRRLERDVAERGRSPASVQAQLAATVRPMHDRYVEPNASHADLITHHGQDLAGVTERIADRVARLIGARS